MEPHGTQELLYLLHDGGYLNSMLTTRLSAQLLTYNAESRVFGECENTS